MARAGGELCVIHQLLYISFPELRMDDMLEHFAIQGTLSAAMLINAILKYKRWNTCSKVLIQHSVHVFIISIWEEKF